MERVVRLFFKMFGDVFAYIQEEGGGGLVKPNFFDHVEYYFVVHGCEVFNAEHVVRASGIECRGAEGDGW